MTTPKNGMIVKVLSGFLTAAVAAIIFLAGMWNGSRETIQDNRVSIAKVEVRLESIENTLEEIKEAVNR